VGSPTTRWIGLLTTVALVVIGRVGHAQPLVLLGTACAAIFAVLIAPESLLALFLFAGAVKGAPGFSASPVDLTVISAAVLIVAILVTSSRVGLGNVPILPGVGVAAALALLVVLSAFWSPDPQAGLHKALRFETFNLLALIAPIVLLRSRAGMTRLAVCIVALSLYVAFTAISTGDPTQPLIVAGGDEIELGTYTAVGVIAAVTYLSAFGRVSRRVVALAAAAYLGQTVIQSGSRGALVSCSVALGFFVMSGLTVSRNRARLLLAAGLVLAALVVASPQLTGNATLKYKDSLFTTKTGSVVGSRQYLLARGWEIAVAHPFGIGAAGFDAATNGLGWPHNIILELADEQGIIGVALFLALIGIGWRARLRAPGGPRSPEALFAGSLILLFLVEALFSNNLDGNRPVWFAVGVALALPGLRRVASGGDADGRTADEIDTER
jgi:O-antigen ligase